MAHGITTVREVGSGNGLQWTLDQKKKSERLVTEKFYANAIRVGGVTSGGTAIIQIAIYRWSTDEDRAELRQSLDKKGSSKLSQALRQQEKTGYIRLPNSPSWDLRYARETRHDGKRAIVLATDRPVMFAEAYRNFRTLDYNTTLIFLELDEENKGTGQIMAGAEISYDAEANDLTVENYSFQPVRLTNVRKTN